MKCTMCGCKESKVIDSRTTDDGNSIRRRRECMNCAHRYTTYETLETVPILVIKNNGVRQSFDVNKIRTGIVKACEKRPVSMQQIDEIVDNIRTTLQNSLEQEVSSKKIGEKVMEALKKVDEVAYVRFASVHRQFKDINTFLNEIEVLLKNKDD